jgi:hypothetical protein
LIKYIIIYIYQKLINIIFRRFKKKFQKSIEK